MKVEDMKALTALMAFLSFYSVAIATTPTITDVTAQQRYPWNGKVDISYTVIGDIVGDAMQNAMSPSMQIMAINRELNATNIAASLSGDLSVTEGEHRLVWDMDADGLFMKSTNISFVVSCKLLPAPYCVIDLSLGADANNYPVSYLSSPPIDGFNLNEYKTTKLVLRRIVPGSFKIKDEYDRIFNVTLTKPFLIGIFEVTQKQYSLVMGSNPSQDKGNMRPVECVSYNMIRGEVNGRNWPSNSEVDQLSFFGRLRRRTNVNLDLPTEAQWEYACRAGTTSKYNNGGDAEDDMRIVGRYSGNVSDGKGGYTSKQTTVGSYKANAWGLYDMHGNVSERCLNWYNSSIMEGLGNGVDPRGPSSGPIGRVVRGGNCYEYANYCTSSYREGKLASNAENGIGFRACCSLSSKTEVVYIGESGNVAIDLTKGTREADVIEEIYCSSLWEDGAGIEGVAVMEINGEEFRSVAGRGHVVWYPSSNGTYVLTHRVMSGNSQIGESQTATFIVDRLGFIATQTTEVPVPYAWLSRHYGNILDEYDAYEAAAKAQALNGRKVWECYVVGLDPNDSTNDFKITSFPMKANGMPDLENISFDPPQGKWNCYSAKPVLKGRSRLDFGDWQVVPEVGNPDFHFFRVDVELP